MPATCIAFSPASRSVRAILPWIICVPNAAAGVNTRVLTAVMRIGKTWSVNSYPSTRVTSLEGNQHNMTGSDRRSRLCRVCAAHLARREEATRRTCLVDLGPLLVEQPADAALALGDRLQLVQAVDQQVAHEETSASRCSRSRTTPAASKTPSAISSSCSRFFVRSRASRRAPIPRERSGVKRQAACRCARASAWWSCHRAQAQLLLAADAPGEAVQVGDPGGQRRAGVGVHQLLGGEEAHRHAVQQATIARVARGAHQFARVLRTAPARRAWRVFWKPSRSAAQVGCSGQRPRFGSSVGTTRRSQRLVR